MSEALAVAAVEDALEGRERSAGDVRPVHARQVIESLAKGIDPHTLQTFDSNHVLNHPQVIRALHEAHRVMEQVHKLEEQKREAERMEREMRQMRMGDLQQMERYMKKYQGPQWEPEEIRRFKEDLAKQIGPLPPFGLNKIKKFSGL